MRPFRNEVGDNVLSQVMTVGFLVGTKHEFCMDVLKLGLGAPIDIVARDDVDIEALDIAGRGNACIVHFVLSSGRRNGR